MVIFPVSKEDVSHEVLQPAGDMESTLRFVS